MGSPSARRTLPPDRVPPVRPRGDGAGPVGLPATEAPAVRRAASATEAPAGRADVPALDRPRRVPTTAAERFRRRSGRLLALALILSVALHFAFFRLFRGFGIPELDGVPGAIAFIELPPEIEIPRPPEAIARPATPTVAKVEVSDELTIAPTTFEANPVESLGPPPAAARPDPSERPRFIPYDTPPRLQNGEEIRRLLVSEYPRALKEAGIGGTVVVWLYVDVSGTVARTLVKESSGSALLDAAAGRVAGRMRFSPAKNRDQATAVWVSQAITFEVR